MGSGNQWSTAGLFCIGSSTLPHLRKWFPDWIVNDMRMLADDRKLLVDWVTVWHADLEQLRIWSDKWLLSFNPDKCKVMHVWSQLEVSRHIAAGQHSTQIVAEWRPRKKWIWDKECFIILYKSFVRPHLEFAIQAWSPYFKRDRPIECLGKVQRRVTKFVKGFKSLGYEARLHKLGLQNYNRQRESEERGLLVLLDFLFYCIVHV